ncbi:ATP synthase F0 subunit 8 (mitochondrion) [Eublepharis macularius]|uniref:ATP synthase complex subunit 8 n=1 Tax=Eublepharis macularius TaxID=481883 RepID=A0A1L7NTX9_EUBMA|nr:ATP synthase F0 subunit 8 [Eublepharis macularius]WEF49954.1 ATP synthase F0 subunit 8 [Eublepharis macularius]BAW33377.1 ATP synthase F0 subunit 8 [Eublepharis macularius]
MPQLNPTPWFMIMMFSWVYLTIITSPLLQTELPNTITNNMKTNSSYTYWHWPWY